MRSIIVKDVADHFEAMQYTSTLTKPQKEWISNWLQGKDVQTPRQSGRTTAIQALADYLEFINGV